MASSEGGYDSRSYSWGTGETRCYVEANITSTSDGSVYISFSGKVRSGNDSGAYHRISGYGVTCTVSTSAGGSCSASSSYNYANWVANCSGGVTCSRQRSAYNVTITCSYSSYNGASNSGSTSVTLTVPAKPSHTISFNANGGSGAPGSITKWYGEQITIPSTKPTRENYQFDGWSTSSTATSPSYLVDQSYWVSDSNQTYYAVWTLLYKAPTVIVNDVYRTSSATSTDENPAGSYVRASYMWSVDTTIYPDNIVKEITTRTDMSDGSTPTCTISGTTTGISGNVTVVLPVNTNLYGSVSLVVLDWAQEGTGVGTASIGVGYIPLEIANNGTSVGLLASANTKESIALGNLSITDVHDTESISITLQKILNILTAADYVVEQGIILDKWTYRKWNSGRVDMWITISGACNGAYMYNAYAKLPFALKYQKGSVSAGASGIVTASAKYVYVDTDYVDAYVEVPTGSSSGSWWIDVFVTGVLK